MEQCQKLLSVDGTQLAGYPKKNMRITEWIFTSPDHIGVNNFDDGGINGGQENIYAPSNIIIKSVSPANMNTVVVWSKEKVLWADGTVDHYSMSLTHANDISDLRPEMEFKQGQVFYREGGFGSKGINTYGNHVHLCVAKGHTTRFIKRSSGKWDLSGSVNPLRLFYVNGTNIINGGGQQWKTYLPPIIQPGSLVKIIGTNYATGQTIPLWVKLRTHTVLELSPDGTKVHLKEINSWLFTKDVVLK